MEKLKTLIEDRKWLPLLAIVLLALFLRVYKIGSVPPGINGDELFNAVDALRLGWGKWQIYFEGNNGREALFIYLMAIPLHLFGSELWAVRLAAILLGVGSVVVAYGIGRQQFSRRVGLTAALFVTVSLWPMMQARWGLRAVGLTFFSGLTIYLYGQAIQRRTDIKSWLLAGLALGLTQYTYIPARIFPIVLIGWFGWLAITQWDRLKDLWRPLLLSLLAALIIFSPYGLYMLRNPEKVNQRLGALDSPVESLQQGDLSVLVDTAETAVRIFFLEGDPAGRYHTSTRPLFDPAAGLFLLIGLLIAMVGVFRKESGEQDYRATYVMLLLWLAIMVFPGAVAGLDTSSLRSAGAVIPAYLLTAQGLAWGYEQVSRIWKENGRFSSYGYVGLVAILGAVTLIMSWHTYFNVWVYDPEVRAAYQVELAEIGRYLNQNQPPENTRVYIANNFVADSAPQTFAYYSDQTVTWFDHSASLAWDGGSPAWYFVTTSKPLPPELAVFLSTVSETETVSYANGEPAFTIYKSDGGIAVPEAQNTADMAFINGPDLTGYDMPLTVYRGETIPVILHWKISDEQQPLPNQLTTAQVFLEDDSGNLWGQAEKLLGYPQANWQPGDDFLQLVYLEVPAGLPPGPVYLRFGLRDWQGQPYEVASSESARYGPFLAFSRPLTNIVLDPETPVFEGVLALREAVFSSLVVPGLPVNISLGWLALEEPPEDYRVQLQIREAGNEVALISQDFELWPDVYPPSEWQKGEQVTTLHQVRIPLDITAESNLQLSIHLLPAEGDTPLSLTQGEPFAADLTLQVRDYLFEVPPIPNELEAQFGENIRLLGYGLDTADARPGGEVRLTLYWQAIDTPREGYTVFNHLIGPDGQNYGQFDSPPVSDAWLTQTWLPGEIVIEERIIPVNANAIPGEYHINIGLYTAFDLTRLPVWLDGQPQQGDQLSVVSFQLSP